MTGFRCRAWSCFALTVLSVACGGGSPAEVDSAADEGPVVVYSGRNERLIGPLLERFTEHSGVEVQIRYGSTSEMAATLLEEGDRTPAHIFISQDAAALGALSRSGSLRPLPQEILDRVPAGFRSPEGDWVGLSGRARVVVYNTERTTPEELPRSLEETSQERYRGRFGVAPSNASFQSHMAAYMAENGSANLEELLRGMAGNAPQVYSKNSPIVEAVVAGEIDWGLVNHYYLLRALAENPDAPARNFYMPAAGGSNFVNLSGAGLLGEHAGAIELLRFLVSGQAQRYFVDETFEYALAGELRDPENLPERELLGEVSYSAVADALDATLVLIQESGLTRFQ